MMRLFFPTFSFLVLLSVVITACQKDEGVTKTDPQATDSIKTSAAHPPGNYLAGSGTLTVKFKDSTYTFNAAQDSIAFVNISIDGEQYYGITAINKSHTLSFGISSPGAPIDQVSSSVSGAQFLLKGATRKNLEYTLTQSSQELKSGAIAIEKYNQELTLARGTFHFQLATDSKTSTPSYSVEGSFDLKMK